MKMQQGFKEQIQASKLWKLEEMKLWHESCDPVADRLAAFKKAQ
jgi:hypothetical protein